MGKYGYHVMDADGHVRESPKDFLPRIEAKYRERLQRILQWSEQAKSGGHMAGGGIPFNYMAQGFERTGRRLLGTWDVGENLDPSHRVIGRTGGTHPTLVASPESAHDPHVSRKDVTELGIDQAVWFPSSTTSVVAVGDPGFEAALCTAYNRWIGEFCAPYGKDFKAVAVLPALDMGLCVQEINRVARERWCVGVTTCATLPDKLPDHPYWHPMYVACQDADLALCIHSGTDRPPYPPGRADLSDNYFLLHMSGHPWQQMRAMAALIGGGVYEQFPKLRIVHLESGCGWVPYWMERMDSHAENLGYTVPKLKAKPSEHVTGGRFFVSFDAAERTVPMVAKMIGEEQLVYASDYPHFDADFQAVQEIVTREDLSDALKRKVLGENAKRLFTQFG